MGDETPRPPVPLRRIIRLFRPYRWRLAMVLGLIAVSSVVTMVSPFLLRDVLDVALPQARLGLLAMLACGLLLVAAAAAATSAVQAFLSQQVGQDVMHDIRTAVYRHLQRMSLAFFTRTRTGEIQSRIANDIGSMSVTVTSVAGVIVSGVTTVVANLVAMLVLDARLTILSVATVPVFVLISRRVGGERRRITVQRQEQMASMSSLVEESLSVQGFLLGRVFGRADKLITDFGGQSRRLADLTVQSGLAGRWRQATIQVIMATMPVLIYLAAGVTANHGRLGMSIGTLVAFTALQQGLFAPSVQLLQTGIAVQSSLAVFDRVFEYLDLPIDLAEPGHPVPMGRIEGHVRFEHVDFCYGDQPVLTDIDIDIPPGTHLAIVGATGAGKTTLGYLIPRLYDVTAGRVTIEGVDVRDLGFATLATTVGVVSQDTHLFHASIADNLRFARPDATDDDIVAAARSAQIHDLIADLPDGYRTVVGERGYRFSGGEKQRLAIARTILCDPPVLVLDEATSALDTRTERAVQAALDALAKGRTTITIAHRLSTVRAADQIIVLHKGHLVERGTHEELLRAGGRYATLVRGHAALPAPSREATLAPEPS